MVSPAGPRASAFRGGAFFAPLPAFDSLCPPPAVHWEPKGAARVKVVVYLDILLAVNFLAGYFLLRAAAKLAGCLCGRGRALAGAAVAAASTLVLLAPALPPPLALGYKLVSAAAVALAAFGWHGPRPFGRAAGWYFALNLALAGAAVLAVQKGGMGGVRVRNLTVYADISPLTLALSVLAVYLAVRLALLLFGPPAEAEPWRLTVELAGRRVEGAALYDTGFFLRDPVGGRQTLLVSWPAVKSQLPADWNGFLAGYFAGEAPLPPPGAALRLVPCRGAAGFAALPGFAAGPVRLACGARAAAAPGAVVVFSPEALEGGRFAALFGREFLLDETRRQRTCSA